MQRSPIKIEKESPTQVTALLNGRDSDRVGRIVIEVEAIEPNRILKLQATAIPRPPDLPLPHLGESELIASLRRRIDEAVLADTFSGTVLLAKNGETILILSELRASTMKQVVRTDFGRLEEVRRLRTGRPVSALWK
jgi:hypothetical protein